MLSGLWASASGLRAGSLRLDALADDLANVNTPGFKRNVVDFAESQETARYRADRTAGARGAGWDWVLLGAGVNPVDARRDFAAGSLETTGQPFDVALQGEGFFAVRLADGTIGYTRAGAFRLDGSGRLVDAEGRAVLSDRGTEIRLPADATEPAIAPDGTLTVQTVDSKGVAQRVTVARIGVALAQSDTLEPAEGVYVPAAGAPAPQLGAAGQGGRGTVLQGALEASNVDLASAMTGLIIAQRAYSLNARALSTADEMWQEANRLYGSV
ncbi:MAG: flagellar hook-basal body protein [Clostridia bacterium]|nr:flagellar hook-basal body protein [Clostridia bacterium]